MKESQNTTNDGVGLFQPRRMRKVNTTMPIHFTKYCRVEERIDLWDVIEMCKPVLGDYAII